MSARRPAISISTRPGLVRCPVCRDDLAALEPARCGACGVTCHRACADLVERCATLGCAGALAPIGVGHRGQSIGGAARRSPRPAPAARPEATAPAASSTSRELAGVLAEGVIGGLVEGLIEGVVGVVAAVADAA